MFETATLGEKFETVSIFSVSSLALYVIVFLSTTSVSTTEIGTTEVVRVQIST